MDIRNEYDSVDHPQEREVDETTFTCSCEIRYETDGDRESFSLILEPTDDI